MIPVRIISENKQTKELFPIGFETYLEPKTIEHKSNAFWTKIGEEPVYVPAKNWTDNKILIVGKNNEVYDTDIFTRMTGKHFSCFLERIIT